MSLQVFSGGWSHFITIESQGDDGVALTQNVFDWKTTARCIGMLHECLHLGQTYANAAIADECAFDSGSTKGCADAQVIKS